MQFIDWLQQKLQGLGLAAGPVGCSPGKVIAAQTVFVRYRPPVYQAVWSETLREWVPISGRLPGCLALPPLPTATGSIEFYERPSLGSGVES